MLMAIITLLSALSISGVAIFYSVIGLATIFPGAFWPVVIMGSVLEVGKLITASWLYRNWKYTPFLLKSYLTIAVVVLSLITSMGIFGFLSKAHLEQNLAENTTLQRIEIINNKISSEETYINRQTLLIERAEKGLNKTVTTNDEAIAIEKDNLRDVQDKFKTLLAVETNTINNLNGRLNQLDKDVSDVLTQENKAFFNEEKAAADLKASQKEERAQINDQIQNAQLRIDVLKKEYLDDTSKIQQRIDNLRITDSDDKSEIYTQIEIAESNILKAQNNIDDLVVEREHLESKMIKLEAEVGPIKYIAALAVDWGVTNEVNTSEAVRWVILIIIFVFDPLAVLLLIAANQSLVKRFPVSPPKPQEIVDLEKPDEDDVTLKWNAMMGQANAEAKMEQATNQLKDWKEKLDAFNSKVQKPEDKPVEIIQEDKRPDPADVLREIEKEKQEEAKEKQIAEFQRRELEDLARLEEYSRRAREEEKDAFDPAEVQFDLEPPSKTVSEELQEELEPLPEQERIKPDLTEVVEQDVAVQPVQNTVGILGQRIVDKKGKVVEPPKSTLPNPAEMTEDERTEILNKFHKEHGNYEDISDVQLKKERDDSNKAQFLADVSLSRLDAEKHPPITESRMAFFQDIIDDILRGNVTYENVDEDVRKTVAQLMDDELPNPKIIKKQVEEERPMTDEELDKLLEGWNEDQKPTGKTRMVIRDGKRIFVPIKSTTGDYVQNEEQDKDTIWQKTKELDLPEPEKNELDIPEPKNTIDEKDIPMMVEKLQMDKVIPKDKFETYKKRITTDTDYHSRIEQRINDLITKLDNGEIKLKDLTDEDQKVIIDILNQNG